jgi:hypothetical protein
MRSPGSEAYPSGLDAGWVALDAQGCVGFFATAGQGPMPASVIADAPASDETEPLVLELPLLGESVPLREPPLVADAFTRFADRGLFVYDWQDVHRPAGYSGCYELVARPSACLTADGLRGELARIASLTRIETLVFAGATMIDLAQHVAVVVEG